jgi:hypothetical protein
MVRSEVPSETELVARWDGGEMIARVKEIPFG